ncbi:phosphoglycerate mutase [Oxalicibacterium flavum]|uniref:Phosphoglycerate mutase n=1 Tax=Oxalicibacterium flavum TaxID=179467 RepID=A0A8J2UN80_9BURK|nr:histidine phosphatase family protein [Oxalicibacterium flavum]GGC03432.1 phosphoglycerate mutase [Oxalicibacterium flavum]
MTQAQRRRVYLMRHGSVTYFDENGHPYSPDEVPLNETGRKQTTAAGLSFAAQNIRFDRVITSDLPRAVESATRVLAETGQRIEIEQWPDFTEVRGHSLDAILDEDLEEAFTSAFSCMAGEHCRFLGGESVGELMDRIHPVVDRLRADSSWDTVLLVLHGGVNRALLSYAITGQRLFLGNLEQSPGCINVLDVGTRADDWVVHAINHAPLLPLHTHTRLTTMEEVLSHYKRSRGL